MVAYRRGPYRKRSNGTYRRSTYKRKMPRRYSLLKRKRVPDQVAEFSWSSNKAPVRIGNNGALTLISSYAQGADDNNRHTNTTYTNAFSIKAVVSLATEYSGFCGTVRVHWWLVHDKQPPDTIPGVAAVFDCFFAGYPNTWFIKRELSDRCSIKDYWVTRITNNGADVTKTNNIATPGNVSAVMHRYKRKLGVKTIWDGHKATSDVGSIKSGALYIVVAMEQGGYGPARDFKLECNIAARMRVYFRSYGK